MAWGSLAPVFVGHRKQRQQHQATDLIKRSLCSSVFESSSPCLVQFPTQSAVPTGCQFSPFWNVGKGVRWRPQKCCPANWRYLQSNPALQTPARYGSLVITDSFPYILGERKPLQLFSLNSTLLIQTPVYGDNGYFFLVRTTDSHRKLTSLIRTDA